MIKTIENKIVTILIIFILFLSLSQGVYANEDSQQLFENVKNLIIDVEKFYYTAKSLDVKGIEKFEYNLTFAWQLLLLAKNRLEWGDLEGSKGLLLRAHTMAYSVLNGTKDVLYSHINELRSDSITILSTVNKLVRKLAALNITVMLAKAHLELGWKYLAEGDFFLKAFKPNDLSTWKNLFMTLIKYNASVTHAKMALGSLRETTESAFNDAKYKAVKLLENLENLLAKSELSYNYMIEFKIMVRNIKRIYELGTDRSLNYTPSDIATWDNLIEALTKYLEVIKEGKQAELWYKEVKNRMMLKHIAAIKLKEAIEKLNNIKNTPGILEDDIKKLEELIRNSKIAYESGDYRRSIDLSERAQDYSLEIMRSSKIKVIIGLIIPLSFIVVLVAVITIISLEFRYGLKKKIN